MSNHPSRPEKNFTAPRLLAGLVAILPASLALSALWVNGAASISDPWSAFLFFTPLSVAGLCLWFAFAGHRPVDRARIGCAVAGGMSVGGVSFLCGFIGPMIFMPTSNQGPLLGIFITGPAGVVLGTWFGAMYGMIRIRKNQPPAVSSKT